MHFGRALSIMPRVKFACFAAHSEFSGGRACGLQAGCLTAHFSENASQEAGARPTTYTVRSHQQLNHVVRRSNHSATIIPHPLQDGLRLLCKYHSAFLLVFWATLLSPFRWHLFCFCCDTGSTNSYVRSTLEVENGVLEACGVVPVYLFRWTSLGRVERCGLISRTGGGYRRHGGWGTIAFNQNGPFESHCVVDRAPHAPRPVIRRQRGHLCFH